MEDESREDESRYDDGVCDGHRVEEIFPVGDRDGNYQNALTTRLPEDESNYRRS